MKDLIVYCAFKGIDYEGNKLLGIFFTRKGAEKRLEDEKALPYTYADEWYIQEEIVEE